MYNFINQSDESLANLSAAVYAEQRRRIMDKIEIYPKPVASLGNTVEDIKLYREMHNCSLLQAKLIVDYYANK